MIPVTIVTGFLGSGKTTLLGGLIKNRQNRRLALLINEFGEVSIDGTLIRDFASDNNHIWIHDSPYGLIAYGDDQHFIPTLKTIAKRRANVDHLLIETSGLALPTAIMELLQTPELAGDFILDATLAVVDTPLLLSGQLNSGSPTNIPNKATTNPVATLFKQQLEYADVVVLNKIDTLHEDTLLLAEKQIRACAPNVRFLELAFNAQLDIRLALGLRLHQPTFTKHKPHFTPLAAMPDSEAPTLVSHLGLNGHTHSGLTSHIHGLTTHRHFHEQDPGWLSFVLRSQAPQHADTLKQALIEVAKAEPLLRCKGFILASDPNLPILVQGVRTHVIVAPSTAKQSSRESEIVFIGYHLNRNTVASLLAELTGTIWK